MNTWRDRINDCLHSLGWDMTTLAERSGVPYPTLQKWLAKKNPTTPSVDKALSVARALGISLDSLFDPDLRWMKPAQPEPPGARLIGQLIGEMFDDIVRRQDMPPLIPAREFSEAELSRIHHLTPEICQMLEQLAELQFSEDQIVGAAIWVFWYAPIHVRNAALRADQSAVRDWFQAAFRAWASALIRQEHPIAQSAYSITAPVWPTHQPESEAAHDDATPVGQSDPGVGTREEAIEDEAAAARAEAEAEHRARPGKQRKRKEA